MFELDIPTTTRTRTTGSEGDPRSDQRLVARLVSSGGQQKNEGKKYLSTEESSQPSLLQLLGWRHLLVMVLRPALRHHSPPPSGVRVVVARVPRTLTLPRVRALAVGLQGGGVKNSGAGSSPADSSTHPQIHGPSTRRKRTQQRQRRQHSSSSSSKAGFWSFVKRSVGAYITEQNRR